MKLSQTLSAALLASALMIGLSACEDQGPLEETGEAIDDTVEDTGDAIEDVGDDAG